MRELQRKGMCWWVVSFGSLVCFDINYFLLEEESL